ncbi:Type cbb3 cytochrome oxidase biogenesis protein CcoI; Copper-translocating P-type ATPase [Janthinobacterium sp. CG23_2]|nr:Type cbb3 cytochrome oxidase biogenesis protein CcoI; Copper-translocating P-type ATPase [Janthinobacterium sp. CG23_2]CUU32829.1 Type cbb3 cytochrome oxidase biogenesis protein CcoI; Copper-translocating P-type ATPase [Janthinobacterium sp. CG23_2]
MSAQPFAAACYHCGLPVALGTSWSVRIDGAPRPMCCPGCEAVAQGIVDAGLADYYRTRSVFADRAEGVDLVPPELALYDSATVATAATAGEAREGVFSLDGIRCAACVWLIERRLARLPGVREAQVNVATERLHMTWDAALCKPSDIVQALRGIGYTAFPYEAAQHGAQLERKRKKQFRQLFVAGLSMMQVMMYALPAYIADEGTMDASMAALMQWASLLLTIPAVLYSAQPFFRGAWSSLRARMPGMDLPVALGIGAAFGASVLATLRGSGEVYYDSVTMFIFLLLASRYLEQMARRKAARALEDLQRALPASAQRLAKWPGSRQATMVAAASLAQGDVILVEPGSAVAADGIILEGHTEVDLALLTGESRAQPRVPGDELPGGAINTTQAIVLRVTRVASDSTLARLVKLVEKAGQGKPQIAQWADKVAAWFVVGLLLLTVAVFIGWQMVDPARAWQVAIAVLVVSCPCALSLATPTALAAATDALVRHGVLVVQPHVLETLQRATHIVFDKTGTLTEGRPVLRHVEPLASLNAARCLHLAAALEAGSAHPLALAIRTAGADGGLHADGLHSEAGQGVEGVVDGVRYRLGRAGYAGAAPAAVWPDVSNVYLGANGTVLARFELADALRADAPEVVRRFRARGQTVILLSGDDQSVVSRTGAALGIDTAIGQQLPEQKLAYVQQLQAQGAVVAMVGDGINDAAVLRAADVSFAMGGGAALAQLSADCVLLSNRLSALDDAATGAARALRIIRQNLAWASVYNCVAIPAAAFGLINPWLSAAGMSLSSAVVVVNALRLRRMKAA